MKVLIISTFILIFIQLIISNPIHSQSTFNQKFYYAIPCLGTNIIIEENGFTISGISGDITDEAVLYQQFIRKVDYEGNHLSSILLGDANLKYLNLSDVNVKMNDSNYLIGTTSYIDNVMHGTLLWINSNGELEQSRDYLSPYFSEDEIDNTEWMYPTDISLSDDGSIFMSSIIDTDATQTDFCILKLTPEGDEIWTYIYSTEADPDFCYAIEATEDGGVLAAVWEFNIIGDFVASKLLKLDADGNEMWIEELEFNQAINDFILEDNAIVVASYEPQGNDGYQAFVYKADTLGNTLWQKNLGGDLDYGQQMTHIVKSNDNGYVVAGQNYELQPDNPDQNGTYNWNGWLAKLDNEGEIVWDRKYHYVESTQDDHAIYDLKATSDGGYIFCGEATDHDNIEEGIPIQQAWLVKVDGCGCLVPGCDPTCTTGVEETEIDYETTHFLAGPNPASQFINIHVLDEGFSQDRELRIFDLQGKLVKGFSAKHGGSTYMVDVEGLESGVYLVSLFVGGEVVQSERVLKL